MGKQKADCIINAGDPTATHIANMASKMTTRVAMLVEFSRKFRPEQSSFWLRSRSMEDRLGPKAL